MLDASATQQDVFNAGVKDVVDEVLQGFNGTIMAYGQTGGGAVKGLREWSDNKPDPLCCLGPHPSLGGQVEGGWVAQVVKADALSKWVWS